MEVRYDTNILGVHTVGTLFHLGTVFVNTTDESNMVVQLRTDRVGNGRCQT